jgi:hypothetical protein
MEPAAKALDEKRSYKTLMAVLGAIAAVIGIVTGVKLLLPSDGKIAQNVELVFDRSAQMSDLLGQEPVTKLAAAIAAVDDLDISDSDNLALRFFGGECEGEPPKPQLAFDQSIKARLKGALHGLMPRGKGSLAHAVIAAMDDFSDMAKFKDTSRRVVVITGSDDACTGDPYAAIQDHVRNQPAGYDVHLDFHFIGVGLTDSQKAVIAKVAEVTKGKQVFVENREQLHAALNLILVVEPVADNVNQVVTILNGAQELLNKATSELGQPGGGGAEADFQAAKDNFKRSDLSFDDLGARQSRPDFKNLYKLASANRALQQQMFALMDKMISKTKSADVEGFNATAKQFNDVIIAYNTKNTEISVALQQMGSSH